MRRALRALAVLPLLAACGSRAPDDTPVLHLVKPGTLTVCTSVPHPPYEAAAGSPAAGFDLDLLTALAHEIRLHLSVVTRSSTAVGSGQALLAGDCDLDANGLVVGTGLDPKLRYTNPYDTTALTLLVPNGSSIGTLTELNGRKVGVLAGTRAKAYVTANAPKVHVVVFDDPVRLEAALKNRGVAAIVQDLYPNLVLADRGVGVLREKYTTDEQIAFVVAQANPGLYGTVNIGLTRLRANGTYAGIHDKYFTVQ
ncbi:MAG: amino acid transporter substrate-binding protein [Marmoricola sp.]|nr:amino acid transporter substrate-binding protein [Marmoricola sp.]